MQIANNADDKSKLFEKKRNNKYTKMRFFKNKLNKNNMFSFNI